MQRLWRLTPFAVTIMVVLSLVTRGSDVIADEWFGGTSWQFRSAIWSVLGLAWVAWPIAVTLLALHPGPARPCCRWPAGCEGCGYTLLGLGAQQTCPECGKAVEQSTDRATRPGLTWDASWRNLFKWWQHGERAIRQPTRLGQSLHLIAPDDQHRSRIGLQLVGAVLSAGPGVLSVLLTAIWLFDESLSPQDVGWEFLFAALTLGTWTMFLVAGVQFAGASLLGGIASWLNRRNLLPAARQGMVCLGGYMMLWVVLAWVYGNAAMTTVYLLENHVHPRPLNSLNVIWLLWLAFLTLNALLGAGYLALLWRILRGARYANW